MNDGFVSAMVMGLISLVTSLTILALLFFVVVMVVKKSKAYLTSQTQAYVKESNRIYNDLPDLGKARVDRNRQMWGKVFIVIFCILFVVITSYLNPLGPLPGLVVVVYWAHRNWK